MTWHDITWHDMASSRYLRTHSPRNSYLFPLITCLLLFLLLSPSLKHSVNISLQFTHFFLSHSLSPTTVDCGCKVTALVTGETTWQNLIPCVLGSEITRGHFNVSFPEELLRDLVSVRDFTLTITLTLILHSLTLSLLPSHSPSYFPFLSIP